MSGDIAPTKRCDCFVSVKCVLMAVWLCVGVFGIAGSSFSDDVMTWEDCIRLARQDHPDLVSARESLNQARADKKVTFSGALPQLTGNAGGSVSKAEGRSRTESYSYGVSGRQLLFDGFKTPNDLAADQERIAAAEYNYKVVSSNVRLDLWTAFIGLLSAQESLHVTKDILDRRQQNLDLVTLQYQSGREHKGSLLTAQANTAQAMQEYEQARRGIELNQRRLTRALGHSSFVPLIAAGDLSVGDIDRNQPDFEKLVNETPLLQQLTARKEAARLGVKSARSDFFPQVFADVGAGRSDSFWVPKTGDWSAGISVSFPIFQGGQKQAALSKARAAYRQGEADERSGRNGVILTLSETWTQWQNQVDQAGVQVKFLEASKLRADIVEAQYTSGLATFNDWSIIEDDLVNKQKALLQAKTNALVSMAGWLQAKGETLDE